MAHKMTLILAVALAYISAPGALPTRVPGIYLHNPDPGHDCLVVHELKQPVKTPPVHPAILCPAFTLAASLPDVFQVLEHYHGPCRNAVHDPTRQDMVAFFAKPIDLPAQKFEFSPSRLGAFALQDPSIVAGSALYGPPFLWSQELVELSVHRTHDGGSADAEIDSCHEAVGNERVALTIENHVQEQSVFLIPNQFARADLPFSVFVEVFGQTESNSLAASYRGKGGPSLFESDHRSTFAIVANSLSQGLGTLELFGPEPLWFFQNPEIVLLLEGTNRTEGLGGFTDHGTDKLGWELGQGSFLFVAHPVDRTAVGCFGSESLFSGPIEGICELGDSGSKGRLGFWGTREFESECHIHIHLLYKSSWFSFEKVVNNLREEDARNSSTDRKS